MKLAEQAAENPAYIKGRPFRSWNETGFYRLLKN
jgi:hypothetical protein